MSERGATHVKKCIVKDCTNLTTEGTFVGDLCMPCHSFIAEGQGVYSQAYRNAHEPLRVVAAAILTHDGMIHSMPRPARHDRIVHALHDLGHPQVEADEQGFLLSDGRFCRRKGAKVIAKKAGQLLPRAYNLEDLYSEDVW